MSTKILYFITGFYAQRPKESITGNRLFFILFSFWAETFF